jgi:nitroimidazol reductase NimA-like FMN-containing flavoprotein (pyridoxamine 5'-phosphate oxidase superfamily)
MARSRTTIRRHPERALVVPDDAEAILARALVAHVGIVEDGQPFVLPFTFLYQDGAVYIHGAPGSRTIRTLAAGAPVCIEVTLVDGLIASKSAETHSVNYRSVVCFGRGALVTDDTRRRAIFEDLIGRYFPGRTAGADYAHITAAELKRTWLVEVRIDEMSAKGRAGGPRGPFDTDPHAPGNAGIHPVPVPS